MNTTGSDARSLFAGGPLTGKHVLMTLLGFFGVIFAVNFYFLTSALSTHTGLVAVEPYRKGLAYNDRIAAGERQSELGWTGEVLADVSGRIVLSVTDRNGRPVERLALAASLGRPSTTRHDLKLAFAEQAPGRYVAQTSALGEGSWLLAFEARVDAAATDPVYRMRRRLWLKP